VDVVKVLVTGGAGFIGSHIVDELLRHGHQVTVVDNLSTGQRRNVHPQAEFVRMDIYKDDLNPVFARGFDAVIHQAAQPNVPRSLKEPVGDAEINILGTIRLLEACRQYGVKKVIYASSAAVYGNPRQLPIPEEHPVCPLSPYGISKLTPESYLRVYQELYGLRYTVLRYANVYGPRQNPKGEAGVIAIFVDQFCRGEAPVIYGDGEATRDYVYVGDVAAANRLALTAGDGEILNVATGKGVSVNELVRILLSITQKDILPVHGPVRPGDILHSTLANERIRRILGWEPKVALEEGLRQTVAWALAEHAAGGGPSSPDACMAEKR
jgi:UDP-glucose 4-epimerase